MSHFLERFSIYIYTFRGDSRKDFLILDLFSFPNKTILPVQHSQCLWQTYNSRKKNPSGTMWFCGVKIICCKKWRSTPFQEVKQNTQHFQGIFCGSLHSAFQMFFQLYIFIRLYGIDFFKEKIALCNKQVLKYCHLKRICFYGTKCEFQKQCRLGLITKTNCIFLMKWCTPRTWSTTGK